MVEITPDMETIIKQAILSFVATVNEDGTPNLSPKASLTVRDGVLYFADIASPRTVRNLKTNDAIEINVVDVFQRRGYRFTGRGVVLSPSNNGFSAIASWVKEVNGAEYPVDHVVQVKVISVAQLLSPAHVFANPPRTQKEIEETYRKKYGAQ